jgi:hypothetical protein
MSGRGRGRRAKVPEVVAEVVAEIPEETQSQTQQQQQQQSQVKPKRGAKKKFSVVAVVTHNSIEGSLQPEVRKPLIAHLPIESKDVIFHDTPIIYNPIPPTNVEPYDAATDDPFSESVESLQTNILIAPPSQVAHTTTSTNVTSTITTGGSVDALDYYKKGTLLVQYQGSEETKTLPEHVDIACFWCCHRFDSRPVILPVRDQGEYIQVMGNFCSPECSMAYLFDMQQDSYARWEQLSLLNRLYGQAVFAKALETNLEDGKKTIVAVIL